MFEYNEHIEEKYLWNFSKAEKAAFLLEHKRLQKEMDSFESSLFQLMTEDSSAIFANYEPRPTSPLAIKYTFNRMYANDPRETELCLSEIDPPSEKENPYAKSISWALKDNTHCQRVVLSGIRTKVGFFRSRSLNDEEAVEILNVLSDKRLSQLTFTGYPLLTEKTYAYMADILTNSKNKWGHLVLGNIPVSDETAKKLKECKKVSFKRLVPSRKIRFAKRTLFGHIRT